MKSLSKIAFCFLAFIMPTFCFAGSNSYTTETIPLFADAVFEKSFISNNPLLEIVESKEDPNTGLVWQKVKMNVWVENAEFTQDLTNFWANTKNTYKTECSVCHKQRDPKMHDANEWIAVFNGMVGFTDMDEATQKKVLRYLQMNAASSSQ
ncbi:hypothetical protein Mh1961_05730 [Mannheimia haemolytica]